MVVIRDVQRFSAVDCSRPCADRWEDPAASLQWTMGVGMDDVAHHRVGPYLNIRTFLVEAFRIPTESMESTLQVGDFLLVDKAVYCARVPARAFADSCRPARDHRVPIVVPDNRHFTMGDHCDVSENPAIGCSSIAVRLATDPSSSDTRSIPCPDALRAGSPVSAGAAPALPYSDVSGLA